jgi:hypothetical protein
MYHDEEKARELIRAAEVSNEARSEALAAVSNILDDEPAELGRFVRHLTAGDYRDLALAVQVFQEAAMAHRVASDAYLAALSTEAGGQ